MGRSEPVGCVRHVVNIEAFGDQGDDLVLTLFCIALQLDKSGQNWNEVEVDRNQFSRWYEAVLKRMYGNRDNGFAIMLITIPILERYVRCKNNLERNSTIGSVGLTELLQIFPEAESTETIGAVWDATRNGLLHQLTFFTEKRSKTQLPIVRLTHDTRVAIRLEDDRSISINPVHFSRRVVRVVKGDFATFCRDSPDSTTPLPVTASFNPGSLANETRIPATGTETQR